MTDEHSTHPHLEGLIRAVLNLQPRTHANDSTRLWQLFESAEAAENEVRQALAALPGGGVACHRLHTSDGKARWMWVDGPPSLQAVDDARNFGWTLELAYTLHTPTPHEADRNG